MTDTTSTDVATIDADDIAVHAEAGDTGKNVVADAIARLQTGGSRVYSSLTGDDFETRLRVLSAVQQATPLGDVLNEPFTLKDVVIQEIEMTNPQTGEVGPAARVILLTDDGRALYAISKGILSAVENFIGMLGQPSNWPDTGVRVKMVSFKARIGKGYTLQPVFDAPGKK